MIVVISLLGVAMTLGGVMFSRVAGIWNPVKTRNELNETADRIFDEMRKDFTAALPAKLAGGAIKGSNGAALDPRFFKVALDSDRIVIPVQAAPGPNARPRRFDVTYEVDRTNGATTLMRVAALPGGKGGSSVRVADGVLALCIEYAGKGQGTLVWSREWKEDVSPAIVCVSLTLMDPNRPFEQIARKAAFRIWVD
jgi:hypothetical protein